MIVSVTGTRHGMSDRQRINFLAALDHLQPDIEEFHHGRCVGVDIQAAKLAWERKALCHRLEIVAHPGGDNGRLEAEDHWSDREEVRKDNHARNRDLVEVLKGGTDILIVMPYDNVRRDDGGTWYTYRHAVERRKRIYILWPDGRTETEGM